MSAIMSLAVVLSIWSMGAHALPVISTPLTERAQFEALCADLTPIERMRFGIEEPLKAGSERAVFIERQKERRSEQYSVELPWSDFFLSGALSPGTPEGALHLLMDRPFMLFQGSVTFFDLDRDGLLFIPASEGGATDALREGLQKGSLRLVLHFRMAAEEPAPCSKSKLGELALSVNLIGAELVSGSRTVALARDPGLQGWVRQGIPTLTLRPVQQEAPGNLPAIIEGLTPQRPALENCYAQSLMATPGIEGMIAYELKSNTAGRLETSVAVADSIQSPMLESCISAILKEAKVPPELQGTLVLEFSIRQESGQP